MKRVILMMVLLLSMSGLAQAVEVAGVKLADSVEIGGKTLQLNGYGIRKKFFFKVYVGSLYTAGKATSTEQVVNSRGGKLIRMNFLYSKVEKEKIVGGFAKGIENNAPELRKDPAVEQFLALFDSDFVEGDQVDLAMSDANSVSVTHNDRPLGTIRSANLVKAVLLIYLGNDPADDDMKAGMLGNI